MQKLITIHLDEDTPTEEHLQQYLKDGWQVADLSTTAAGTGHAGKYRDDGHTSAWVAVVLEK